MAMHRHIGFINEKAGLNGVDPDFRKLVELSYSIPGFGSYGVSCSGHFYPTYDKDKFYPNPWAYLGLATIPEMKHIPPLLELIHTHIKLDPDAKISIQQKNENPSNFPEYKPGIDLKPDCFTKTKKGLYISLLEIRLGANRSLDTVPDHMCAPIELEGNDEAFKKSQQRCSQIKKFWKGLENAVRAYVQEHNFKEQDLRKKEFLPFF